MVGDRVRTDLGTAKELGMETVFIDWGRNTKYDKSVVDHFLETVYDVESLL